MGAGHGRAVDDSAELVLAAQPWSGGGAMRAPFSLPGAAASAGLRLYGGLLWRDFDRATARPRATQAALLRAIVRANTATAFGRAHGFARIENLADYRRQVPMADYERFRPYVERVERGAARVLTRERPHQLLLTSGTTGVPKYLPLTRAAERAGARLAALWLYRALGDHPRLLAGNVLAIVGAPVEGRTPGGLPYGCASGQLYQAARLLRGQCVALDAVWRIPDHTTRYYTLLRLGISRDVSFLATPNPSTLLRLVEIGEQHQGDLLRDLHDGGLTRGLDVPAAVRVRLGAALRPEPARARALARAAERVGQLGPRQYWPDLQLVGCWTGGSVGLHADRLRPHLPPGAAVRDLGYLASEGQFSLPIHDADPSGILALTTAFYEFLPADDAGEACGSPLLADELTAGASYRVVLTTLGGLYRYDINDVVRVTGWHRRTPLLAFVRKGSDMASITGEKLHVDQVMAAVRRGACAAGLPVAHYCVQADAEAGRYELLLEFAPPVPTPAAVARLAAAIDTGLGALNVEYQAKRASGRLGPPRACAMRPGWFERRLRPPSAPGGRDAQAKPRLLRSTRDLADAADLLFTVG
jgi:hypothetical protein